MQLTLNREEANTLLRALDHFLPELEFAAARVKLPRNRHSMVVMETTLRQLRERLAATAAEDQEFIDGV